MPFADEANAPLLGSQDHYVGQEDADSDDTPTAAEDAQKPFSFAVYAVFLLLGLAMLWPWNMFLAAAPYFQRRFQDNEWILNHFQSAEVSVGTLTNLVTMLVISSLHRNASYPKRILLSLIVFIALFVAMAISTSTGSSAQSYFGFLLLIVLGSMISTGLIQNSAFALTAGFGRKEYTQAMMTGQAVAGVLPPLLQIVSVAAVPARSSTENDAESSKSAFAYFLTAAVISGVTLMAFLWLLHRKSQYEVYESLDESVTSGIAPPGTVRDVHDMRNSTSLTKLFMKVPLMASAVFVCFMVTMVFPVFTSVIQSVNTTQPAIFIPVGFLLWNIGDLLGRLTPLLPQLRLFHYPFALFSLSMVRLLFIPLYFLCNIKGRGAIVDSDLFYLGIVQLFFGISNGYVGSNCIMGASDWVTPSEREVIGGFMSLCMVAGLTTGSFLSFLLGDI